MITRSRSGTGENSSVDRCAVCCAALEFSKRVIFVASELNSSLILECPVKRLCALLVLLCLFPYPVHATEACQSNSDISKAFLQAVDGSDLPNRIQRLATIHRLLSNKDIVDEPAIVTAHYEALQPDYYSYPRSAYTTKETSESWCEGAVALLKSDLMPNISLVNAKLKVGGSQSNGWMFWQGQVVGDDGSEALVVLTDQKRVHASIRTMGKVYVIRSLANGYHLFFEHAQRTPGGADGALNPLRPGIPVGGLELDVFYGGGEEYCPSTPSTAPFLTEVEEKALPADVEEARQERLKVLSQKVKVLNHRVVRHNFEALQPDYFLYPRQASEDHHGNGKWCLGAISKLGVIDSLHLSNLGIRAGMTSRRIGTMSWTGYVEGDFDSSVRLTLTDSGRVKGEIRTSDSTYRLVRLRRDYLLFFEIAADDFPGGEHHNDIGNWDEVSAYLKRKRANKIKQFAKERAGARLNN